MAERSARKQAALKRGRRGEWLASVALRLKGYRIVARNYRTKLGEIDLIARRGTTVAIVEVKARASEAAAHDAVGGQARQRIANAADLWLSRQPDAATLSLRFDIVAVVPGRWPRHVENAWQG